MSVNHNKKGSSNNNFGSSPRKGSKPNIKNSQNYLSTFAAEEAINDIRHGYRIQVIMRGLPGSGKSYLAKTIVAEGLEVDTNQTSPYIFSTDNYFMRSGWYAYDVTKIEEAHNWNKKEVSKMANEGMSPIIIDNTNTQLWEMIDYTKIAVANGYRIRIIEPNTKWCFNVPELAKRNSHNVPYGKIKRLSERYEKNILVVHLLNAAGMSNRYQCEPMMRRFPPIKNDEILSENHSSGIVSNHNYMNADLKLPGEKRVQNNPSTNNSLFTSEVSMPIEISDDDCSNGPFVTNLNAEKSKTVKTSNLIEISDDESSKSTSGSWLNTITGLLQPTKVKNDVASSSSNVMECLSNFEEAWGINNNLLRNWNFVSPVRENQQRKIINVDDLTESIEPAKIFVSSSTITELHDFNLVTNSLICPYKILQTKYRDINDKNTKLSANRPGFLDKSSSTQDDFSFDRYTDLKRLTEVFKNIPPLYIRDMYDSCRGDFDMTVEIFLEDNKDYSDVSFSTENILCTEEDIKRKSEERQMEEVNKLNKFEEESSTSVLDQMIDEDEDTSLLDMTVIDYPSSNLLNHQTPSCSKLPDSKDQSEEKEKFLLIDSDMEEQTVSSEGSSERYVENTIELNLGYPFIDQLEKEFGDPCHIYPQGFQPVVQVPKSLARQLYAFYIESVYQQLEAQDAIMLNLEKEDEAFARRLQEEQNSEGKPKTETPNLRDIMHEQAAISIYEKEVEAVKKEITPNDLASILTRKKLYTAFPMIDQSVINEILLANNGNYNETVEDLSGSIGVQSTSLQNDIKNPPVTAEFLDEIKRDHQSCELLETDSEQQNNFTSQNYRDEAKLHLEKRQELHQKAQEHYSRGQPEVAQFYIELASKQTKLYNRANGFAAAQLLEEHSKRLCNFDTLDLHYLYVAEAIQALDIFIDRNINLLQGESKQIQNLFVITGRGNHSKNKKSRIKPAVIHRLKERSIRFVELNPGLLKIKVTQNTKTT